MTSHSLLVTRCSSPDFYLVLNVVLYVSQNVVFNLNFTNHIHLYYCQIRRSTFWYVLILGMLIFPFAADLFCIIEITKKGLKVWLIFSRTKVVAAKRSQFFQLIGAQFELVCSARTLTKIFSIKREKNSL